ncbi:MAG: shikimate dehydrogenase [Syntrophomonas sp.]|nr:shikimate dehydrogenase [Syntrophomonas sp.]
MIVNHQTALMGIIGNPLGHSLSPLMHNSTLAKMGLNYVYLPLQVAPGCLRASLEGLRALNFIGVNVTVPYKKEVIQFLDELSPEASACEAVNLIRNKNGHLVGYNTDGRGFMASLEEEGIQSIHRVIMIGAGGAAYSIAYELSSAGAEQIDILDIEQDKAAALAEFVNQLPGGKASGMRMNDELFIHLSAQADLVINCTPVGMFPNIKGTPVSSLDKVRGAAVIYDLIYNPLVTRFLAMAEARQLKTINGSSMLVHQGALTLEILTGVQPPLAYMKEVILNSCQRG